MEKRTKKLVGNGRERAVSPVIGVILMVAITVILAAVIAAFVLDLGGSIQEEAQAGVQIENEGEEVVTVSVTSLGNADGVYILDENGEYVQNDGEGTDSSWTTSAGSSDDNSADLDVGGAVTVDGSSGDIDSGVYSAVAYIGSAGDPDTSTTIQTFEVDT